jgi:mannose-6-phosphate isomerase-like protein (cupin superfamily)
VRAPVDTIPAPSFPKGTEWVNVATLRMDQQRGRPVLVEFWDFCRVNSLRTLPYIKAWHARYAEAGLRVIGVHTPGFEPSADPDAVREAVARLDIPYAVAIDSDLAIWNAYENAGWPARYVFDQRGMLHEYHYGEGGYVETERAIQSLLGIEREPLAPMRPEERPGAKLVPQTPDQPGAYSGPYEAGAVWAVLEGRGEVRVGEKTIAVDGPGCYLLIEHPNHTAGVLDLQVGDGVRCHATCFTPGIAP